MRHMVVAGFAELSSRLKAFDAEVDVVSFDIFDTLLERHVKPPEALKIVAAQRTATIIAATGETPPPPAALLAARQEAEAMLRRRAQDLGFDPECAFSDIAWEIAHRLAPGREEALRVAIIDGELEAELEALYLRQGTVELLSSLRSRGKRIIAISDMYLDEALLARIFRHLGLGGLVDRIYVSADHKMGKYSGRLFRHALQAERISPERMIHVGDHPHSDFNAPRTLGIRAFHLNDASKLRHHQIARVLHWLGERNPFWRGHHLLELIPPPISENFHYRYGYSHLGPIFCGFVLGVLEKLQINPVDKVFFLAREGALFRDLYVKLAPSLMKHAPPHAYLYLSRKTVLLPASWHGLSRHNLHTILCNPKQKGLLSVANALSIPPGEFADIARRFDLESVDQPTHGRDKAWFASLLADDAFQKTVASAARPARLLLRRYLKQEGFFGNRRVALVDIGWNGTIQNALQDAFGDEADSPETLGLYLSYNDGFHYGLDPEEAVGILFDKRTHHYSQNVFALFEELFENAARAPHGTTIGYRERPDGRIDPILRPDDAPDRQAEREIEQWTDELQHGVLDFADAFCRAVRLTGFCFADIKPALLAKAERLAVHPTAEEAAYFLQTVHAEDLGSDNVMNFNEYRLPGLSMLLHPKRLLRLLRTSNWRYGTARTLGLPGFNHLLRRAELFVRRRKCTAPATMPVARPRLTERVLLAVVKKGGGPHLNRLRKVVSKKFRR